MLNLIKVTILSIILLINLSCSGIESKQIKLKDFKEPETSILDKIDIGIDKKDTFASYDVDARLYKYGIKKYKKEELDKKKCSINAGSWGRTKLPNSLFTCPLPTNIIAPLTLFIIPLYCVYYYEAEGYLLQNTDPDNPDPKKRYKILKKYQLKDKVHELWSALYFPPAILFGVEPPSPQAAKSRTFRRISEALARQILNDLPNHKECYKDEKDFDIYQQQQQKLSPS